MAPTSNKTARSSVHVSWRPAGVLLTVLLVALSACAPAAAPDLPQDSATSAPATQAPAAATATQPEPSATASATPIPPTTTASATPTEVPPTGTPSPVPTYAILRGTVNAERAACRYGPGSIYLYLYGLIGGARQDVIGRTDSGSWVLTRSRGDNKDCWMKADLLTLDGDPASLEVVYPDKYQLPVSPYYTAPWDVAAVRSGSQVTITWQSQALRAGDEESADMLLYIVEVWTCQGGVVQFTPHGTSLAQLTVTDEPGCSQPSHGRVFFQEKHGFAGPSEIPWPPAAP